jgi:DNA-binding transcriptional ArsR family regulator
MPAERCLVSARPDPPDPPRPAQQTLLLDARAAQLLAAAHHALGDSTRAQIVRALDAGPLVVSDLTQLVGRPRTVISQHLRVLRKAGLVETQRQGRWQYYRLAAGQAMSVVRAALEAAMNVSE